MSSYQHLVLVEYRYIAAFIAVAVLTTVVLLLSVAASPDVWLAEGTREGHMAPRRQRGLRGARAGETFAASGSAKPTRAVAGRPSSTARPSQRTATARGGASRSVLDRTGDP